MADYRTNQERFAPTASRAGVDIDQGLRSYMLSVYNYMALGIALSAVITLVVANSPALFSVLSGLGIVFFIALIAVSWFGPNMVMNARSEGMAHAAYWGYAALWGLAIAPMVVRYLNVAPNLVVQAFATTALLFGAMSLFGYTTKRDMTAFGRFAVMAMFGIIIAAVINIFMGSSMFSLLISGAYVLLISGITAYETQVIKEMYVESDGGAVTKRKAIFGAFMLYGSFISMFIHILNILGIVNNE